MKTRSWSDITLIVLAVRLIAFRTDRIFSTLFSIADLSCSVIAKSSERAAKAVDAIKEAISFCDASVPARRWSKLKNSFTSGITVARSSDVALATMDFANSTCESFGAAFAMADNSSSKRSSSMRANSSNGLCADLGILMFGICVGQSAATTLARPSVVAQIAGQRPIRQALPCACRSRLHKALAISVFNLPYPKTERSPGWLMFLKSGRSPGWRSRMPASPPSTASRTKRCMERSASRRHASASGRQVRG